MDLTRALGGGTSIDTYSYVGAAETVARIANTVSGATDSIVSPAGDRLGVKVGTTVNWFVPDLHGSIAASVMADESKVTNAIRYDAYGETLATAGGNGAPAPVGEKSWKYRGRLDLSPTALSGSLVPRAAGCRRQLAATGADRLSRRQQRATTDAKATTFAYRLPSRQPETVV